MPEITNNFLKSKMNKDLDDRLIPNGEYRDAINLQISRSEGSSVGEFENILGNSLVNNGYLQTGSTKNTVTGSISAYHSQVIGQYTDEPSGNIFIFSTTKNTGLDPTDLAYTRGTGQTDRDITVNTNPAGVTIGETIVLYNGTVILNPQVLGIKVGMSVWGPGIDGATTPGDPIVSEVNTGNIKISWNPAGLGTIAANSSLTFGWNNTIHVYNVNTGELKLLVKGGFLNFNIESKIYGINLLEGLLFWTDNRNQPRRINVNDAIANAASSLFLSPTYYTNEDQISVAKYYPYEVPLVLEQTVLTDAQVSSGVYPAAGAAVNIRGYEVTLSADPAGLGIKIGDLVTGFPGQGDQELWEVIWMESGGTFKIVVYNNFSNRPGTVPNPGAWTGTSLTFSRPTMTNESEVKKENGFTTTLTGGAGAISAGTLFTLNYPFNNTAGDPSGQPTPQVGDYITSTTMSGGITLADEICVQNIDNIIPGTSISLSLTKPITAVLGDDITIGANPDYNSTFTGDPDFIEDKFVRFSYRFKFIDNEYSIIAPFSQICFIPRQFGYFGGGQQESNQDMIDTYSSTVVEWFENRVNNIGLKIPLPSLGARVAKASSTTVGAVAAGTPINISLLDGVISLGNIVNSFDTGVAIPANTIVTGGDLSTTIELSNDVTLVNPTYFNFIPDALTSLTENHQVKAIEIIYKESDSLSTKVLESLDVIDDIATTDISTIPSTSDAEYYYTYKYKSSKPYKTLPENQTTRVYDKAPIKALAQEVTANRITYGNFVENHTPPSALDYETLYNDKSISYNNYVQYPNHSVKQNRNYQAGFVLGDRYGRQSSVILSSNDNNELTAGSTVYVPYKTWNEVQFTGGLTTYEWLGSVLRVKLNNGISSTSDSITGEPGIYKSYNNTEVDSASIVSGGAGYVVGDTCTTVALPGNIGLGAGFTFTVQSVAAGVITGIKITKRGSGYANGQVLDVVGGTGTLAQLAVTVNPPNVLGWQSYKIVVKQQEQEYYNVYLPGYVDGYPVTLAKDRGRVAFASLFSDNINKVPRDLNEVGPLQTEFSASVLLYGRVNNPSINNRNLPTGEYYTNRPVPWNTQYFPGRKADEVTTIGPIGQGGLELANSPFSASAVQGEFTNTTSIWDQGTGTTVAQNPQLPWGPAGADQSFYNVEQNPLAIGVKVGSDEPQPQLTTTGNTVLNTLGAYVTNNALVDPPTVNVMCMNPFLSISETEPVESALDIFWESSTTGDFAALNRQVVADYAGVSGMSITSASTPENDASGTTIPTAASFSFEDSAGNELTLDGIPTISQVFDNFGNPILSTPFIIDQDPLGVANKDFRLITNTTFWYGKPTINPTSYLLSFTTSYTTGGTTYTDVLSNIFTVNITNIAPNNLNFVSTLDATVWTTGQTVTPTFSNLDTNIGTFSGDNGSVDLSGKLNELCWSVAETAAPGGSTAVFSIDKCTGVVTVSNGSLSNGTYTITGTLTDATPDCGNPGVCNTDATSLSTDCVISFTVGTPPTDRSICFGADSNFYTGNTTASCSGTGSGKPLEVFFGQSASVNNANINATGSSSQAYLSGLPGTSWGSRITTFPSDLAYYNVLAEAQAAWTCGFPIPTPPGFLQGALTQGEMYIKPRLIKQTATALDYNIFYTIIYRTVSGGVVGTWQQATCITGSTVGGAAYTGAVSTWQQLQVSGAGVYPANPFGEDSDEYVFSAPGEYAVVGYYITGAGCLAAPGGSPDGADFRVDFGDQNMNPSTPGWTDACTDCTGPLNGTL